MKEKKSFLPSLGFWPAKNGNGFTLYLDEKAMATLSAAAVGGRLVLTEVTDAKSEKAPSYRVLIMPPSDSKDSL